jgi:hypothetical protein
MRFAITLLSLLMFQSAVASEFEYLPDQPGKANVIVARANTSMHNLPAVDAAAFNANLEHLRDLLIAQPEFNPPKGVAIDGYMRANDTAPKVKGIPVPAFGHLLSQPCFRDMKSGQPTWLKFTTDEIVVRVNYPQADLCDPLNEEGSEARICYEPKRTGEINGFPVFQTKDGDELIVLSNSGKLLWVPYTREEFTNQFIRFWQEQTDKTSADTLSPAILKGHREFLARMSPEERKMPARALSSGNIYEPGLAPVGSDMGEPLVKINPQWFDPSMPRSAFQLIVVRFHYSGKLDSNKPAPDQYGLVSALRLWQYLHSADWKAIAAALSTK